jgi:hypothetical protein
VSQRGIADLREHRMKKALSPEVRCVAIVNFASGESDRCLIRRLPGKRYCWHHQSMLDRIVARIRPSPRQAPEQAGK